MLRYLNLDLITVLLHFESGNEPPRNLRLNLYFLRQN
jgi:hypothetical protein